MIATNFIDKTIITRLLVNNLMKYKSPKMIKARNIIGFEIPEKIAAEGGIHETIPDIVAICDNGIHIYKIELHSTLPVYSWKLLSGYAKKNKGVFYIVVADEMRRKVEEEIIINEINAHIIIFPKPSPA